MALKPWGGRAESSRRDNWNSSRKAVRANLGQATVPEQMETRISLKGRTWIWVWHNFKRTQSSWKCTTDGIQTNRTGETRWRLRLDVEEQVSSRWAFIVTTKKASWPLSRQKYKSNTFCRPPWRCCPWVSAVGPTPFQPQLALRQRAEIFAHNNFGSSACLRGRAPQYIPWFPPPPSLAESWQQEVLLHPSVQHYLAV